MFKLVNGISKYKIYLYSSNNLIYFIFYNFYCNINVM